MASHRKIVTGAGILVLSLAATAQFVSLLSDQPPAHEPNLSAAIPAELPGWRSSALPLADTEELKGAVIEILKFDEYISVIYQRGPVTLTLYAAYWSPGKVPPRAVGVHTPDTCWVQNGWTRKDRRSGSRVPFCMPAEFGVYSLRETTLYVHFWHVVGGRTYAYEQEGLHSLTSPLQDLATFGLRQRREQLFVRLAANVPFNELENDAGYLALTQALARLGLADSRVQ